tara:strand:+ start:4923 stop:7283 length:2361 start_codon:yes stop_codon:yes gene_type:complete
MIPKSLSGFLQSIASLVLVLVFPCLSTGADFVRDIEPILIDYCFDCHGDGVSKGDFLLDDYEKLDQHLTDHDLWFTVWENTRSQLMPPSGKKQPSAEQRAMLKDWIEREVFKLDPANPDPGRVTIRRLNREEYENTIYDVFGHRFNAEAAFPPDDTGYGFDTIGDVLSISPLLMEKYVNAAQEIVSKVVHTTGPVIPSNHRRADQFVSEKKRKANWIPFDQPDAFTCKLSIGYPGDYRLRLDYKLNGADNDTANTARVEIRVNGKSAGKKFLAWGDTQTQSIQVQAPFIKGENVIEIELTSVDPAGKDERTLAFQGDRLHFDGPLDGSHRVFPSNYEKIFIDGPPPEDDAARTAYLRKLIDHWGLRLLRRPVSEGRAKRLMELAQASQELENGFEKGVAQALTAILASPRFLFRAEVQPEPNNPGKIVPIVEFALASRLSYFLWSSAPDPELLQLAAEGKLRTNLRQQIDRMIKDRKGERFVKNFTGQWLQTRDLDLIYFDPRRILNIDDQKEAEKFYNYRTKEAMRWETEKMFEHVLRENRPVTELLVADYTFLNQYTALTYGIEGVEGRDLRKVSLPPDSPRGGILGQGTFLAITSNPTRTSPVKRGLFVLENLLGTPAPPAPEEVPSIEQQRRKKENRELTMRELMKVHAEEALCASCHARFDPIGLALENYNALGMWREEEGGTPIDAGGKLITGEPFANAKELSKILATERKDDFYRCLTEKLLTYAIGRGVEFYDAPTIEKIVENVDANGGGMMNLIYGIAESVPFQKRRGDGSLLSLNP